MSSKARELANLGNAYSDGALSNRNKVINGAMAIDQRNGGSAVTATSSGTYFAADRYRIGIAATNAFSLSAQQVSDAPDGFVYSNKFTVNTSTTIASGDTFQTGQRIEYSNSYDLGWNDATARYYVATYTISASNTWEQKTVTVASPISGGQSATLSFWVKSSLTGTFAVTFEAQASPSQAGTAVYVIFDLGQGSTYQTATPNTWTTSVALGATTSVRLLDNSAATWQITGVQLEVGDTATPFEHRSYGQELALCQRYFQTGGNCGGRSYSTQAMQAYYQFPVQMRATPTITKRGAGNAINMDTGKVHIAGVNNYDISTVFGSDPHLSGVLFTVTTTTASMVSGTAAGLRGNPANMDAEL